jgi:NitT/TauT family transport system ATP-binding protein|tara:strand:- start:2101 stop:2910 length:810 start_codon:yes stop_codon:yes gene_type:complete
MASIEIKGVSKQFQLDNGSLLALDDVSLTVGDNEFVTLIGPSGCGKSTLLRLVADILQPTSGEILLHGVSPQAARERLLYSFVFQNPVMMPWRTVIQNVSLPLEIVGSNNIKEVSNSPAELLTLVGLKGFENATPDQLSGGMKQRAAIARSLLLNPKVLLMDEPFGALDEISRDRMNLELLRIWLETDAAVLFVTHSIEEAVFLSDRVIVLSSRPGTIRANVVIDIPRPRALEIKQSEQCFQLGAVLRQALAEGVSPSDAGNDDEDVIP